MRHWLKTSRIENNLTMKTLSKKLDISESYYCAIENGIRQERMDMALASRISVELKIPLDIIARNENLIAGE
jgi:Helix-turn-helix.